MKDIYYKVLNAEGTSPTTKFDYTPYLPHDGEAGVWLPEIPDAEIRSDGYYASKYWNFWYSKGDKIYEVEVRGIAEDTASKSGVCKQICCRQMRLLRDATEELVKSLSKSGRENVGQLNTGRGNLGDANTGEYNIGSRNTGKLNLGDFNTGDSNSGLDNVGDFNRGTGNVGCRNIGHSNSGSSNEGSYNSGSFNIGNKNSGSFNIGNSNSGRWNIGNAHSGFFNTGEAPLYMFDKPVPETVVSDIILPKWLNPRCGFSKKILAENFAHASLDDIRATLNLPNFDYGIFEKITGISRADFDSKLK